TTVLLDGLVACGVPDLLRPHADRLRLIVLVHLPLADEFGLCPHRARTLDMYERATLHLASKVVATSTWAAQHLSNHHDLATVHAIPPGDRKSTRLNSSHVSISYAVFCLKKK